MSLALNNPFIPLNKETKINHSKIHRILWDFEIQTDPLIPVRNPEFVFIDKKKDLVISWSLLVQRIIVLRNNECGCNTSCCWRPRNSHQGHEKKWLELEIRARIENIQTTELLKLNWKHPDHSTGEIELKTSRPQHWWNWMENIQTTALVKLNWKHPDHSTGEIELKRSRPQHWWNWIENIQTTALVKLNWKHPDHRTVEIELKTPRPQHWWNWIKNIQTTALVKLNGKHPDHSTGEIELKTSRPQHWWNWIENIQTTALVKLNWKHPDHSTGEIELKTSRPQHWWNWIENIQTTALVKLVSILWRVPKIWCHSGSTENPLVKYLSLVPTRQDLIQGQWPEGQLKWRRTMMHLASSLPLLDRVH